MRNILTIMTLITTGFYFSCQSSKSTPAQIKTESEILGAIKTQPHRMEGKRTNTLSFDGPVLNFVGADINTDSTGNNIVIYNSGPRGGAEIDEEGRYYDPIGTHYGHGVFWSRTTNETNTPLDISINFPSDSFAISNAPDAYFKLLLPPDTMTLEKRSMYNYGIKDYRSFLDANFNKPTSFHRTVNPNDECLFYVCMLIHVPQQEGAIRAGLILNEKELFYKVSIYPLGSDSISIGQLSFKN